eukprot:CAMPEP_0198488170 /NCGR_PEP_ID=MMETSP1462-20131121/563_1 /TAXON_ID=1333877 /ORGANISM="Brandtodinium nutriculum, Strain RCC3387" /LENGTH=167 /DNA_ID=CAMNT_0044216625 /DNA_START=105 /DNA_END=605 /DNA_ORIENTATION=+
MSAQGVVKNFFDGKAFGFITHEGQDVFVHIKDCQGAKPVPGDTVTFDLDPEKAAIGQLKAVNVLGCTGSAEDSAKGKGKGKGKGSGSCQGTLKSFSAASGYGFIDFNGTDVFCHVNQCVGNPPQKGDWLTFDLEESRSKPGKMNAANITGGTGFPSDAGAWGGGGGG